MERPSHSIPMLAFQTGGRRFAGAGLSVIAQLAFVMVLIGGFAVRVAITPPLPPLEFKKLADPDSLPPPPPIKIVTPSMPTAIVPLIDIAPEASGPSITVVAPQPVPAQVPVTRQPPPIAAVPDRAAAAIPETHTSPPYPPMARRLGVEGKVTLRLSVLPDGSVNKAEVVKSSGRPDLDLAAQQWITGHWTYQPAIRDGAPAAAQVLAAVAFTLTGSQ